VSLILVGLNHQTAPVALRERLSLSGCGPGASLNDLTTAPYWDHDGSAIHLQESVFLSTCNRLEVYAVTGDVEPALSAVESFLAHLLGLPVAQLHPHLYLMRERAAAEHLFRVAAGMDSIILGEPQILGQVVQAYERAQEAGTPGPVLSQLFSRAIHTGKRARSETAISRHTTSVSHAAARLARDTFGDLGHANVLIVGAGETAELAAIALHVEGARRITCVNRTYERGQQLAGRIGGRALDWDHLIDAVARADVIVTATSAPHAVIHRDDVAPALATRNGIPLVIVDIAVPRDVEPEVGDLPGVLRFDMDHVHRAVDANRAQREAAVPQVLAIIEEEIEEFFSWLHGREVVPVIVGLRRKAEAVAQSELELMLHRLGNTDEHTKEIMALFAHRIVGKLLHEPTVRLKSGALNGHAAVYSAALAELFALDVPRQTDGASPDGDTDSE
jgi:glutamyl-tRNA reductase